MFSNSKSLLTILQLVCFLSLCICTSARGLAGGRKAAAGFGHEALHRRQNPQASLTSATTYTIITPSLSATPVPVTLLSQVVTSYVPQFTHCAVANVNSSSPVLPTPWLNSSSPVTASPVLTNCTTKYSSTLLTVCATTLQGLGSTVDITACSQQVTFSSQYGCSLIPATTTTSSFDGTGLPQTTITAPPSIDTITSYYIAPWQALTGGINPANVTERICSLDLVSTALTSCLDVYEIWSTTTITSISSYSSVVDITTTISGSNGVIIVESITASVAEAETVYSLSTTLVLTTSVESLATRTTTVAQSTSTVVAYPAGSADVTSSIPSTITSTTTLLTTSTIYHTITTTLAT